MRLAKESVWETDFGLLPFVTDGPTGRQKSRLGTSGVSQKICGWNITTVGGRNPAKPVEVGSLSHDFSQVIVLGFLPSTVAKKG